MCDFVVSSFVSERHRYDKKKEKKKNGLINEDSSRSVCAVIHYCFHIRNCNKN